MNKEKVPSEVTFDPEFTHWYIKRPEVLSHDGQLLGRDLLREKDDGGIISSLSTLGALIAIGEIGSGISYGTIGFALIAFDITRGVARLRNKEDIIR